MKKLLIIAVCSVLLTLGSMFQAEAQVSGHRGGWLLVKTDLMTPLFDWGGNVQLEFVAFRKLTFTIDYNYQNRNVMGNYAHIFKYRDVVYVDNLASSTDRSVAHTVMVGLRFYMNRALPAPNGYYMYVKGGAGRMFSQGEFTIGEDTRFGSASAKKDYTYKYGPMRGIKFEYGYGYQFIFFKRMVLDVGVGLNLSFISGGASVDQDVDGEDVSFNTEGAALSYGGNLLNWGFGLGNFNGGSNVVFTQGFSLHLSLGILAP